MNIQDLKDPVLADFADHHRIMARRLKRNVRTGCLEYDGPTSRVIGNPILRRKSGETVLLRRYFYEQYKGAVPPGKFVRMKCGNRTCHAVCHMGLKKSFGPYTITSRDYLSRYDRDTLRAIRYYRNKVSRQILAKIFHIPPITVLGIWRSSSLSSFLGPSKHYRPAPELDRQVERLSAEQGVFLYLCPKTLREARATLIKARGSTIFLPIVRMVISGIPLERISQKVHQSKGTVINWYRRGLVELLDEFGHQRWMDIVSKCQIQRWKISPYNR
jgi:hypothetical protein